MGKVRSTPETWILKSSSTFIKLMDQNLPLKWDIGQAFKDEERKEYMYMGRVCKQYQ